jgi:hemolysin III
VEEKCEKRVLTLGEEIANSITHGVGLVASLAALPILVSSAARRSDSLQVIACSVFAGTLIALYAASTLYHALPASRAKQLCRILDHSAIYLLIAGTYTPFTLGVLYGVWGWTLLGAVWGFAIAGIACKATLGIRFERLSTALYVLMGWIAIVAAHPIIESMPTSGLLWLLAGGLLYTGGVAFFVWERQRYSHTIWHVFVLGGSVCHFFAVLWYAKV